MDEQTERPLLLKEAGFNFSLAILLYLVVSSVALMIAGAVIGAGASQSDLYKYFSYLFPQLCFGAASLIYFRRKKGLSPREVYSPCKWYYIVIALLLAFGLFSLSWLNQLFVEQLAKLGYVPSGMRADEAGDLIDPVPTLTGWNLLPAILVIALLPALFEETLFRGIQVRSMQRQGWGLAAVVLISGALFSLFHGNPEQTLYQFACGCAYALLASRSGSVFPTMVAHFANNAAILALGSAGYGDIPAEAQLPVYLTAGIVLVGVLVFLVFFAKGGAQGKGVRGGKTYFLYAAIGIAVCAALWIFSLVTGFLQ